MPLGTTQKAPVKLPEPPAGKTGWPWTIEKQVIAPEADWPKVTIVTPSLNQGRFLEEAIRSVLLQGYPNLEYVIMDAGSTDQSVEIIRKYEAHLMHWVSTPDKGQSDAINRGWQIGTGEIVAWLNADDLYEPGVIFEAVTYLAEHKDVGFVCGNVNAIAEDDSTRVVGTELAIPRTLATALKTMASPGTTAAFIRREALDQVGYLNSELHYWIDPELWIRIGLRMGIGTVPKVWYRFRVHSESKTRAFREHFYREALATVEKLFKDLGLPAHLRNLEARVLCIARLQLSSVYFWAGARDKARSEFLTAFRRTPYWTAVLTVSHRSLARTFAEYIFGRLALWPALMRHWKSAKQFASKP